MRVLVHCYFFSLININENVSIEELFLIVLFKGH